MTSFAQMFDQIEINSYSRTLNQNQNPSQPEARRLVLEDYISPQVNAREPYRAAKDDTHNLRASRKARVLVRATPRAKRSYIPLHEYRPNSRWYRLFCKTTGQVLARIFGTPRHIVAEVRQAAFILNVSIDNFYLKSGE